MRADLSRLLFFRLLLMIPVPWVYVLAYLVGVGFQLLIPFQPVPVAWFIPVKIAGAVLFLLGAFFAAWSLLIFHKAKTTTTPGEQSREFIQKGPYKLSRNPMYVSLLLAYLGEAGLLVQVWPVFIIPLLIGYVNGVVIPLEEKTLLRDFKEAYADYLSKVRRWL